MNIRETEVAIKVMQHWIDGCEVEYSRYDEETYTPIKSSAWDWNTYTYRIKQAYRPYTKDEMNEREWIGSILTAHGTQYLIVQYNKSTRDVVIGSTYLNSDTLFKQYTENDHPVGMKVDT